jgi:hypothetical protein
VAGRLLPNTTACCSLQLIILFSNNLSVNNSRMRTNDSVTFR